VTVQGADQQDLGRVGGESGRRLILEERPAHDVARHDGRTAKDRRGRFHQAKARVAAGVRRGRLERHAAM
jgi:hypothetical protein